MTDEYLVHYGVLGMKWGVRRTPEQLGRSKKSSKSKKLTRKKVSAMSDDELRKTINRMQMEKQYSQLANDSNVGRGKKYMQKIAKSGTTVAVATSTFLTIYNNFDKIDKIIKGK